ncbi:GNAT family N-acetyltransferase [bacterium]|nr:GNAT family N-acetyltransferase [bacterium]
MQTLLTIKTIKGDHCLSFGVPDTDEEKDKMFRLRYQVYVVEKKYGHESKFAERKEIDEYDEKNQCQYFIAVLDKELVGTVRLVKYPFPVMTEFLGFPISDSTKDVHRNQLAEVSRMISKPPRFVFPRHFITLGLLYVLLNWGISNGIKIGYGVVERSFEIELKKFGVPFYQISGLCVKENSITKTFSGYFLKHQKDLFVFYFLFSEMKKWLERIVGNELIFKRGGGDILFLRSKFIWQLFVNFFKFQLLWK